KIRYYSEWINEAARPHQRSILLRRFHSYHRTYAKRGVFLTIIEVSLLKYTGRDIAIWLGIGMFILFLFQGFGSSGGREIRYSDFLDQVDRGQIKEVTITGSAIDGVTNDNRRFSTISPETDNGPMIDTLRQNKVSFD